MRSLAVLQAEFTEEVGTDLFALTTNAEVERWLNAGQRRLRFKQDLEATLAWAAGATEVALPADCWQVNRLVANSTTCIPPYQVRFDAIRFLVDEDGVAEAGGAKLLYQANYPTISAAQASLLTEDGDDAILAFALYRFFRKLATNRSDYRRYSTAVGQGAATIDDLIAVAGQHLDEFLAVRDDDSPSPPTTFFGE